MKDALLIENDTNAAAQRPYRPQDDLDVVAMLDAQRERDRKRIDYVVNAAIWFACGMLIMGTICLMAAKN